MAWQQSASTAVGHTIGLNGYLQHRVTYCLISIQQSQHARPVVRKLQEDQYVVL